MKKPATNNGNGNRECGEVNSFVVSRVRQLDSRNGSVIFFSLNLNGVSINNVRVAEGKNGDFISLPQYRGSDGKWYSTVFFRFSPDDETAILAEVEKLLNK